MVPNAKNESENEKMNAGKKKKQPPPNAYSIFMREFQATQREMGRSFSLAECANLCADLWAKLPPEERMIYQERADDAKQRVRNEKMNSKGVALHKIHQLHLSEEMKLQRMNEDIECTVQCLDKKTTLLEKVFHVIHMNYFCKTDKGSFYPAEIALAEFTLRDGIIRVVHSFTTSGELETGYRSTAMEHCNDTHRTPLDLKWGNKMLESKGPDEVLSLIVETLQAGPGLGELPPLYTMPDEVNTILNESCVLGVLGTLCEMQNLKENTFKVYSLPKLFYELRNKARENTFPSIAIALNELEKDVFKYTNGIACDFHEEEDVSPFCSKSIVQRYVYMICDHVCKDLGIRMRPGFHCPRNADLHGSTALKENRSTNPVPQKETPLREPHVSRASSYWDSEASSVASSMTAADDDDDLPSGWRGAAAKEPPKRSGAASGTASSGWSKIVNTGEAAVPKLDNFDDFPSIGGPPARSSNNWTRGRGRHLTDRFDDLNLN
ncbi:hypothetical protein LSTR_LSTR012762 [Laodelphax striatellus]|uniref:HMG box domain-containing protein n=1 Tax=Laodelphax striatellus TaxID=195883 RepID=A0A482X5U8_LAOST|nr:hypothetical protein LSTR_LSTR012762 [Laodelphax striatellus]